jgi:hypothetical protein
MIQVISRVCSPCHDLRASRLYLASSLNPVSLGGVSDRFHFLISLARVLVGSDKGTRHVAIYGLDKVDKLDKLNKQAPVRHKAGV